jgi:hypothetical protein
MCYGSRCHICHSSVLVLLSMESILWYKTHGQLGFVCGLGNLWHVRKEHMVCTFTAKKVTSHLSVQPRLKLFINGA